MLGFQQRQMLSCLPPYCNSSFFTGDGNHAGILSMVTDIDPKEIRKNPKAGDHDITVGNVSADCSHSKHHVFPSFHGVPYKTGHSGVWRPVHLAPIIQFSTPNLPGACQ